MINGIGEQKETVSGGTIVGPVSGEKWRKPREERSISTVSE